MARIREDQPLVPSVLDRLIDEDPSINREAPKSRGQVIRELKLSVRRDLENLLNTRWRPVPWPRELTELEQSLVNYGIPDFTAANLNTPQDRDDFRLTVERTIRMFEPRFKSIKVVLLDNTNAADRVLRFRIDAMLHATPAPEPVVFDSTLEPSTATFDVQGGGR
jgi:type VI secretion system protein ImpF